MAYKTSVIQYFFYFAPILNLKKHNARKIIYIFLNLKCWEVQCLIKKKSIIYFHWFRSYNFFFIGNQFCSFKTRLSVFKSNFKKRSFPWQHHQTREDRRNVKSKC
jgi:hypothetical protein